MLPSSESRRPSCRTGVAAMPSSPNQRARAGGNCASTSKRMVQAETEDGMVQIAGGVGDGGADVLRLKVGKVGEDFLLSRAAGEHVEHVFDADAHSSNARASAAL